MPTEFIGFFDCEPLAIRLKHGRGHLVEQVRGELQCPDAFQLGEFLAEVVQRRAPRVSPEFMEQGAFEGGGSDRVSVGDRGLRRTS